MEYDAPVEAPRPRPAAAPQPAAAPRQAPARGLFAEPAPQVQASAQPASPQPVPPPAPRNSLFGIVTGAIRGRAAPAPLAEAPRSEPSMNGHAAPGVSVRQAQTEEMGLDIPAFLRRQSS
jgi:cell division protein FtsZ